MNLQLGVRRPMDFVRLMHVHERKTYSVALAYTRRTPVELSQLRGH